MQDNGDILCGDFLIHANWVIACLWIYNITACNENTFSGLKKNSLVTFHYFSSHIIKINIED